MSRHLVQIVRDVEVQLDLSASVWGHFDRDKTMALLRALGFHSLAGRLRAPEMATPPPSATVTDSELAPTAGEQLGLFGAAGAGTAEAGTSQPQPRAAAVPAGVAYATVTDEAALAAMVAHLGAGQRFALDSETTSTDPLRAALVGLSFAAAPGVAYYVPVGHDPRLSREPQLPLDAVRRHLAPLLADAHLAKVMHNSKFDLLVLGQHGLPVAGPLLDTMLAAWLLTPTGRGIGLKEQAWQRLGVEMTPISDLIGVGAKAITMDKVSISRAAPYACADADMTLRLLDLLTPELEALGLTKLFLELEMPLVPVLQHMEEHGMAVDADYLGRMSHELAARLDALTADIHRIAGHPFNVKSTKQLAVVLFDELKLKVIRNTATGYSTDSAVLEALHDAHPIVPLIEEYRQVDKIKSTYVDALPTLINPRTGRVHTSFNQTGASTGRLSSSDPNLQNIPIRTELGRLVRGAFVAPPGHLLLACDYSQVELRLLAHLSQDAEMLAAFHRDEDVHASTAAAIFGIALAEVTKEQRDMAKAINFGLMYGMTEFGLSARTDLNQTQAREFIAAYFGRFRGVKEYLDGTIRFAHERGYVETILGRRRLFPELKGTSANSPTVRAAERAAVNMPIQGSAADIIKLAMIELDCRLRQQGLGARLVLQVHDELDLEVPIGELDETRALVVETMSQAYPLSVPLKVDVAVGKNWMEME
ncbi:MAG: DNA polymerase I, partial [Chloroflexota bacterium]